jgi:hypothetical protein
MRRKKNHGKESVRRICGKGIRKNSETKQNKGNTEKDKTGKKGKIYFNTQQHFYTPTMNKLRRNTWKQFHPQ